jgi:hypothetical protein
MIRVCRWAPRRLLNARGGGVAEALTRRRGCQWDSVLGLCCNWAACGSSGQHDAGIEPYYLLATVDQRLARALAAAHLHWQPAESRSSHPESWPRMRMGRPAAEP